MPWYFWWWEKLLHSNRTNNNNKKTHTRELCFQNTPVRWINVPFFFSCRLQIGFHFTCYLFVRFFSLSFSLLSNIKTNIWVFPFVENTEQLHKKNPISNKWQQYANSVQMKRPEMNASKQSSERAKTYVCDIDPKKHLLIVISLTPIGQCIVNSITGFNLRNTRTFGRHTHTCMSRSTPLQSIQWVTRWMWIIKKKFFSNYYYCCSIVIK